MLGMFQVLKQRTSLVNHMERPVDYLATVRFKEVSINPLKINTRPWPRPHIKIRENFTKHSNNKRINLNKNLLLLM